MEIALITAVIAELLCITALFVLCTRLKRTVIDGLAHMAHFARATAELGKKQSADVDDVRNYITEVEQELRDKLNELQEKYDAADEMIHQVTRSAEEAAATEKRMQDGIDAILNYNSQKRLGDDIG